MFDLEFNTVILEYHKLYDVEMKFDLKVSLKSLLTILVDPVRLKPST